MLSEFEKALVHQRDLDLTAKTLMHEADVQRDERRQVIEHDLHFAKLIQQALLEPTGSGMYCIAKAYLKQFQKRHNPHGDTLARQLMKEAKKDLKQKGREKNNHEPGEERTEENAEVKTTIGSGEGSTECVHPCVQESEQGPST